MVAREATVAATLRAKDEEIENLIAWRTQDLMQGHQESLDALVLNHGGKLKEDVDHVEAIEAARIELAGKVERLEVDLAKLDKEISMLKGNREKTLYDLAEMQTTISNKTKLLPKANESIDDLKLKLES